MTMAAKTSRVQIVRAPAPIIRVQAPRMQRLRAAAGAVARKGAHLAKAGARVAAKRAWEEKHTIAAVGAAAGLGLLESQGVELPSIPMLGVPGTYGLALWLAGRWVKSNTLSHMATGLLCVGSYELAKGVKKVSGEF
jgi:hypothetical protein